MFLHCPVWSNNSALFSYSGFSRSCCGLVQEEPCVISMKPSRSIIAPFWQFSFSFILLVVSRSVSGFCCSVFRVRLYRSCVSRVGVVFVAWSIACCIWVVERFSWLVHFMYSLSVRLSTLACARPFPMNSVWGVGVGFWFCSSWGGGLLLNM